MIYLGFIQNLGMQELIIIFVVALLIFGPKNLPRLGRALGQSLREFKDASNKMAESLNDLDEEEKPKASRQLPRENREESSNVSERAGVAANHNQ